ncbi:unnamed protein product, partial [Darwinula stevensoni]
AIVENLSGRKLSVLAGILLAGQIACFLLGGLIGKCSLNCLLSVPDSSLSHNFSFLPPAPSPSNVMNILATKCIKDYRNRTADQAWFYPRGEGTCRSVSKFTEDVIQAEKITANEVVFAFQASTALRVELDYSRWMQNLIGILMIDVLHNEEHPMQEKVDITLEVRLGYRNKGDAPGDWKLLAESQEVRSLHCSINQAKDHYLYDCPILPLFELGSLHHDYYLLNVRIPVEKKNVKGQVVEVNAGLGSIEDLWLVVCTPTYGFPRSDVSHLIVESIEWCHVFPAGHQSEWGLHKSVGVTQDDVLPDRHRGMAWFWHRITLLSQPPALLERMLLALGCALSILNLPLEYLSLFINMPWMLLFSDVRQGIFYATLLSFWLIFAGEHLMDEVKRNSLKAYWGHLSAVFFGCFCLFVFDMCERGTQLQNPFHSIWETAPGSHFAVSFPCILQFAFIILAGISACIYFLFLAYMIYRVFINISAKQSALPSMSSLRRMHYQGIIYRFKFLMLFTLLTAALTVSEGRWKWDEDITVEYTSAFFTGVYGMWNIYVLALLAFYAPSHKKQPE